MTTSDDGANAFRAAHPRGVPMNTTLANIGLALALLLSASCRPAADKPVSGSDRSDPPAPAEKLAVAPAPTAPVTLWRCGEILLTAAYHDEKADLSFSGRTLRLPIARSGSGARYADDKGNELWSKGDEATFTLAGEERRDCVVTRNISPWEQARARGAVFRAIGQEPGWWVEIGGGDSPPLHAELDYGARKIDIARTQGISSTPGFGGSTADGTDVVLRTKPEPCNDDMSGERFEASAELTVGGKTYKGCGAYLDD
jgi:putative lipoprotein